MSAWVGAAPPLPSPVAYAALLPQDGAVEGRRLTGALCPCPESRSAFQKPAF